MRTAILLAATCAGCSSPAAQPDAPSSPWSQGPNIPVPRLESGVTALGTQLVVIGGFDTDIQAGLDVTHRVDVFDTSALTWSQFPDAPVARHHVQIAALGTTVYLLGGLDGSPTGDNEYPARGDCYALDTLDPTPAWRTIAAMPAGMERGSAAVVVQPPRIYLFGGASTTDAIASNMFYDTLADAWCPGTACTADAQLPDLPAARSHPAAMRRTDGTFAVIGGLSKLTSDTQTQDVFILATADQNTTGTWTTGMQMPIARGGCAYGVVQGKMICAGGEAGTSALFATEGYDPIEDMWTDFTNMPDTRAGTLGAAIGERLYVPGGARQIIFEPTDTLYIFSPLDTPAP